MTWQSATASIHFKHSASLKTWQYQFQVAQEAEDDRVDDLAERYGLSDFSYVLHKALEQEGDEEARMRPRPRCGAALEAIA